MKSERQAHNLLEKDDSNGYRTRKVFGDKHHIELQVPPTRDGGFYPVIFGLLKNQERESRTLSFHLYKSG